MAKFLVGDVVEWKSPHSSSFYKVVNVKRTRLVAIDSVSHILLSLPVDYLCASYQEWPESAPTTEKEAICFGTVVVFTEPALAVKYPGLYVCVKPDQNNRSMFAPLDSGKNLRVRAAADQVSVRHIQVNE